VKADSQNILPDLSLDDIKRFAVSNGSVDALPQIDGVLNNLFADFAR
jgi:hypothetical protein